MRDMNSIIARFPGQEATVAAVADYMRRHNLAPADVLAAYEEWMAALEKEMRSVKSGEWSWDSPREAANSNSSLHSPLFTLKKRHKAGDFAVLPRACPRCGSDVELYQLCAISSPVWRTQLACMTDGCAWHAKSRLSIDALLARGLKNSVECEE